MCAFRVFGGDHSGPVDMEDIIQGGKDRKTAAASPAHKCLGCISWGCGAAMQHPRALV